MINNLPAAVLAPMLLASCSKPCAVWLVASLIRFILAICSSYLSNRFWASVSLSAASCIPLAASKLRFSMLCLNFSDKSSTIGVPSVAMVGTTSMGIGSKPSVRVACCTAFIRSTFMPFTSNLARSNSALSSASLGSSVTATLGLLLFIFFSTSAICFCRAAMLPFSISSNTFAVCFAVSVMAFWRAWAAFRAAFSAAVSALVWRSSSSLLYSWFFLAASWRCSSKLLTSILNLGSSMALGSTVLIASMASLPASLNRVVSIVRLSPKNAK